MSARRTILRASAWAALLGAGYAIWQQPGLLSAAQQQQETGQPRAQTFVEPMRNAPAGAAFAQTLPPEPAATLAPTAPQGVATPISAPVGPSIDDAPDASHTSRPALSPFGLPCGLSLHGAAMPGALVALDIMAPCRPDMRVEISHAGLTIADRTDAAGILTVDMPAFETPAFFNVRLADGEEAVTVAGLPDLIDIGRVGMSWEGNHALELHAFENGAAFGEPGHVWQEAPGGGADIAIGAGGVLIELGNRDLPNPRRAQVYSFPRAIQEDLRISVDIPVREQSCGRPMRAESHQIGPDGRVVGQRITLVLPGCEAVGEYLVLQNLFEDLRLASN